MSKLQILLQYQESEVKLAPSLSHIDKVVIDKSDKNIQKLLKKIDKNSSQYVEWMRNKQLERVKQGYSIDEDVNTLGQKAHELNQDIFQSMQKSMNGVFINKRRSIDLKDSTTIAQSNLQSRSPMRNHGKHLSSQAIINAQSNTTALTCRPSMTRQMKTQQDTYNQNAPQRVFSARKRPKTATSDRQPPDLKSLYNGDASYLDYKRRQSPIKTKTIVENLENPEIMMQTITDPFFQRSHMQSAREDVLQIQSQLKFINKEKSKVDQQFINQQITLNKGRMSQTQRSKSGSYQQLAQNNQNHYHNSKDEMLHETLRMHQNGFNAFQRAMKDNKNFDPKSALVQRQNIQKQYSLKGLKSESAIPLNHTIKSDHLKLLFQMLKQQNKQNLEQVQNQLQNHVIDDKYIEQKNNQQKKREVIRSQSNLDIIIANIQKVQLDNRMKTFNQKEDSQSKVGQFHQKALSKAYTKIKNPTDKTLYKITNMNDSIDKKVGNLIFLTSNAGSKLGEQKNQLKSEFDKKEQKAIQAEHIRSGSPDLQRKRTMSSHQLQRKQTVLSRSSSNFCNYGKVDNKKLEVIDSDGNILSKTQALRELYYKRQMSQYGDKPSNIAVDRNLQKVLEFVTQDQVTALPKRNALNIIESINKDIKKGTKIDNFIVSNRNL
eukprot:403368213